MVHLLEAFCILIEKMDGERRRRPPLRDGIPGRKFVSTFTLRHKGRLRFAKPIRQEGERFAAANADALTTHFATVSRLGEVADLDPSRIWNLDETERTPEKDISGACASRRFMRRNGITDAKMAEFANTNRSTMMPVVSAAGEAGPVLFVFEGSSLVRTETLADCLPRCAVVACRE